jgi:hypothetical protein
MMEKNKPLSGKRTSMPIPFKTLKCRIRRAGVKDEGFTSIGAGEPARRREHDAFHVVARE